MFARYLFSFFHDSRLHVLAELREMLPSAKANKRGRVGGGGVHAWFCASICVFNCNSESVVFFDRCVIHQYESLLFSHGLRLCQHTSYYISGWKN